MTVLARLASGSVAAWVQIIVNILLQITLVPLYLSYWDKETYGIWQMIQAIMTLATMFDIGHQTFLANEFSKVGDSDRSQVSKTFYSSLPIAGLISLIGLGILVGIVATGAHGWWFGLDITGHRNLLHEAGIALIIQTAVWLILGSSSGIAVRALIPFGHYTRMTWWGISSSIITFLSPAIAVTFGSGLLLATIVQGLATGLFCIPMFAELWRIMKSERIQSVPIDWTTGFRNLAKSLLVTAKLFLDMTRSQGVRLMLSPIVGVADMAAFATMRTGANVALQGLGTIVNPLMPELMRFLRLKDQDRTETAFGFVWLMVLAMCPAVILIQCMAPPLFEVWTRGKFEFDPVLFAMLSVGVLIYALAQPAVAVVQGNNFLCSQLLFSGLASGTVIGGLLLLVPSIGVRGAAIALIAAEGISLIGYTFVASSWLKSNSMRWPSRVFATIGVSVGITGIALGGIATFPHEAKAIAVLALALNLAGVALHWVQLPYMARSRVAGIVESSLPVGLIRK